MLLGLMTNGSSETRRTAHPQVAQPSWPLPFLDAVRSSIACILHISPTSPTSDDCVQETLRRALDGGQTARGETVEAASDPSTWAPGRQRAYLMGIARYVALDEIRKRQRERKHHVEESQGLDTPAANLDADVALQRKDDLAALHRGLARLPAGQRAALLSYHVDGESYERIAKRHGVPLGTIATWICRARRALAEARENAQGPAGADGPTPRGQS